VKVLAQREREATVALVAHLAIIDERRLFLGEGFASLFTYCVRVLHLSEHAAYNRIEVARAVRKYPIILSRLADGRASLTTVRLLAPHLTPANHEDLLKAAEHKGKREVEEIAAQLNPRPSAVSSVRLLPMGRTGAAGVPTEVAGTGAAGTEAALFAYPPAADRTAQQDHPPTAHPAAGAAALPAGVTLPTPASIEPLGARRYRVQFTATADLRDRLMLARDLLRHQIPDGDIGEIFDRALTLLLEHLARRKFSAADRPRSRPTNKPAAVSTTRYIPAEAKRAVWLRDGGRCAFVGRNGRRCEERGFLEFHHIVPFSAGGTATADNLELRCRAHNSYEATLLFEGLQAGGDGDRSADQDRSPQRLRAGAGAAIRESACPQRAHPASGGFPGPRHDSASDGSAAADLPMTLHQARAGP
jgi:hypothetical protein